MKMIKPTNALIGLLMIGFACAPTTEKKTPSGFTFVEVKKGDGILPKPNQLLVFNYKIEDSKDSVWESTYEIGLPTVVEIQDSSAAKTEVGIIQMFRMLSAGDSVHISKPAKAFFKEVWGGRPLPPNIDSTMTFSCDVRVSAVMEMQKVKEEKLIDEYLAKNNITAEKDTSGIRYVLHSNLGGKKPEITDCVEVKYDGKFLKTGQSFQKNDGIAFRLQQVIKGWSYSVPKLGVGDSATFYIPSHLAYGAQGMRGAIPGDAILIFDITLLKVSSNFDEANKICN